MTGYRVWGICLVASLLSVSLVNRTAAQVSVTPDGGSLTVNANTSGNTATFTVRNNGWMGETFLFSCSKTGAVSSCSAPSPVYVGAYGGQANVNVTFSTGLLGPLK